MSFKHTASVNTTYDRAGWEFARGIARADRFTKGTAVPPKLSAKAEARALLRAFGLAGGANRILRGDDGIADPRDGASNGERRVEESSHRQAPRQSMPRDRGEPCGGDAPAVRAVRLATELARCDPALQIRREALSRFGERALVRRVRRFGVGLQHRVRRVQLRISRAQPPDLGDEARAIVGGQPLDRQLAHLRRVHADPDQTRMRVRLPEREELLEVSRSTHLLPRHGAVHRHLMSFDVFEDPIVGRGLPPLVVLRLQAVDRHDHLEPRETGPFLRNRADGARDDLRLNTALGEHRQDRTQLTIADERLAADDRYVQRLVTIDECNEARDELVTLVVGETAQRHRASEMLVAVGVASGTSQRAFLGNLDRKTGTTARENPGPRLNQISRADGRCGHVTFYYAFDPLCGGHKTQLARYPSCG